MQEGKPEDPEKTCGSKYGLETKRTYGAGTGNRTRAHWCIAPGKNRYATCFPQKLPCFTTLKGCARNTQFQEWASKGPWLCRNLRWLCSICSRSPFTLCLSMEEGRPAMGIRKILKPAHPDVNTTHARYVRNSPWVRRYTELIWGTDQHKGRYEYYNKKTDV